MKKQLTSIIFLLLIALGQSYQEIPLRKDEYGYSIGDKQGDLHIELFIDFLCEDSKQAYDTMMDLMKQIDFYQQGIKLTYQFCPLAWHFFSFKINQALFFILDKVGWQQADKFIAYMMSHQEDFTEQKWKKQKISEFLDHFVQTIGGVIKIDKIEFRSELNSGESWNTARQHWKYSVGTHAVSGTPMFNLNSVRVDGAENFSVNQWITLIHKFKKIASNHLTVVDNTYSEYSQRKNRN